MIIRVFLLFILVVISRFFLMVSRFLNCLIVLEKFKVLLLTFRLIIRYSDNHMIFLSLMVVSTIEIMVGLIVLTRVWECSISLVSRDF